MAEQEAVQEQVQEQEAQDVATSAETQNTDMQATDGAPGPVPYERFRDINQQLKAAQTQLEKLQSAQKQKERAEMTELERVKAEKAEREAALEAAQEALRQMHMQTAFQTEIANQKLTFAEGLADIAFQAADLSSVELGDDGKVRGMKEAVSALAKARAGLFQKPRVGEIDGSAGTGTGLKPQPDPKQEDQKLKQRYNIK